MTTKLKVLKVLKELEGTDIHVSYIALNVSPDNPQSGMNSVRVALHRLTREGLVEHTGRGVYRLAEESEKLEEALASADALR